MSFDQEMDPVYSTAPEACMVLLLLTVLSILYGSEV